MLRWIFILGGLLTMMGHHARSEALFYYFRLEDQVPETHLLRLIDKHVSFEMAANLLGTKSWESLGTFELRISPKFPGPNSSCPTSRQRMGRNGYYCG